MLQASADGAVAKNRLRSVLGDGLSYSQERNQLSFDAMAASEVDARTGAPTVLRALYDYWRARQCGDASPEGDFDPRSAVAPEAARWISWVDVRAADPMNFVIQAHAGYLFGDWSGKALRDHPIESYARSLAFEYLACKMTQQPSYYEIAQTMGQVGRTYRRLLLPLRGRDGQVSRLYYATRYIRIEIAGAPAAG